MKKNLVLPISLALFLYAGMSYANAQTVGPSLLVNLEQTGVATNITSGATNATMANVRLDAGLSTDDIRISSLPITINTGNGANAASLTSCRLSNSLNPNISLNTNSNISPNLSNGLNTFTLDNPLVITRGTSINLLLNCNISSPLNSGGTYQLSINTSNVSATAVSTGLPAVVGVRTVQASTPINTTPGLPNTGFGGEQTTNLFMILGSIALVGLGLLYTHKASR